MADEYTPTTDDVREYYMYGCGPEHTWATSSDDFDRWIAAHDREVAAKAWQEGYNRAYNMARNWGHVDNWEWGEDGFYGDNPYREEADRG